jgi:hypothetical protein
LRNFDFRLECRADRLRFESFSDGGWLARLVPAVLAQRALREARNVDRGGVLRDLRQPA